MPTWFSVAVGLVAIVMFGFLLALGQRLGNATIDYVATDGWRTSPLVVGTRLIFRRRNA
jgi:hypothetical protein